MAVVILIATAGDVLAECVDLNDASHERLTSIVHINEERADQVIAGRPWPGSAGILAGTLAMLLISTWNAAADDRSQATDGGTRQK